MLYPDEENGNISELQAMLSAVNSSYYDSMRTA